MALGQRNEALAAELPALRRHARALARDPSLAEDLVQDTMARAMERWHQRRPDGSLRAWLFTILHRTFLNHRRRESNAPVSLTPDGTLPERLAQQGVTAETRLWLTQLDRAFGELPQEQRQVLLLVAVEGFSYAEAAEAMAIPVGTVMSRLSRARERVRTILEEPGSVIRQVT